MGRNMQHVVKTKLFPYYFVFVFDTQPGVMRRKRNISHANLLLHCTQQQTDNFKGKVKGKPHPRIGHDSFLTSALDEVGGQR